MIHCYFGQDDYSIKSNVDELGKEYGGIEYIWEKEQLDNVIDLSAQSSLFGEQPLIIIRELLKSIDQDTLEKLADGEIIIWEGEKLDKRLSVTKWLQKNAEVLEFRPKQRQEVYAWAREQGYTVDYKLLQIMWDRHSSNLWAWHNELHKLAAFLDGSTEITMEAADVVSARTTEDSIFSFVDAFGNRQKILSLSMFDDLLDQEIDPFYLHSMLARQVRLLILASEPKGLAGNPPFVVNKVQSQLKQWEFDQLIQAHSALITMDVSVKNGNSDMIDELAAFLLTS